MTHNQQVEEMTEDLIESLMQGLLSRQVNRDEVARLVRDVRERCARIAETTVIQSQDGDWDVDSARYSIAEAIRINN